ncbi:MAG: diaminopimelate epimerase [Alphaproteobacteria bacterium]
MTQRCFYKMHGLGNDFVVVDARAELFEADSERIRAIADRRTGVGCDQFIVITPPQHKAASAGMRIFNADGGEVEACGNAARCIARLLMDEGRDQVRIESPAGILVARRANGEKVTVDMGPAGVDWVDIPLAEAQDTLHLDLEIGPYRDPCAVNMGNPHCVFFVDDAEAVDLAHWGPQVEHHPLFPQRTNVEFVHLAGPNHLRMRVWERGVGITRACGTGACASVVAARRRYLVDGPTRVTLDGGELEIDWITTGHVLMTGPTALSFRGEWPL